MYDKQSSFIINGGMSVLTTLSECGIDVLDADIRNDYFFNVLFYRWTLDVWRFNFGWYFVDRFDTSTRCKL